MQTIRDWSEVWSLLIPLAIIIRYRRFAPEMRPIVIYVYVALLLNLGATILYVYHASMPSYLKNNNIFYNLHSFARVLFFSWYITSIRFRRFSLTYKILLGAYLLFVIYNFTFLESIFLISSKLFTAESILLLILCLTYFIPSINDDSDINWIKHPSFLVCTGISLYEAIDFFIFLFFYPLYEKDSAFGKLTMTIHHIIFTVLCIMLALALYRSRRRFEPVPLQG